MASIANVARMAKVARMADVARMAEVARKTKVNKMAIMADRPKLPEWRKWRGLPIMSKCP